MKKKHVYLKGELGLSNFFTNLFRLIFIVTLTTSLHTEHNLQQNLPNSISGIKKNAKVGDFVMLKGRFVRKVDTNVLEFTDDGKQAVLVNFEDGKDTDFIKAQIEYELWGKIIRNDKLTFVDAVSLSKI